MYRQSPSRNQRSKGVKVKYAIQICLLLAVSFWLIYQVKHSHDKKKEFDETEAKASIHVHNSNGKILGRKGINAHDDETTSMNGDKLHESIEEEENVEEEENKTEDEENKLEEDENKTEDGNKPEEDESKTEDGNKTEEDESKTEDGNKQEDENKSDEDENKSEEEENKVEEDEHEEKNIDHEQENLDADETEARELDSGGVQTEGEKRLSDESDHDGNVNNNNNNNKSTHEARDENYKADDASSAVTHEAEARTETSEKTGENLHERTVNSNEHPEINVLEEDNKEVRKDLEVEGGEIGSVDQKSNVMVSEPNVEFLDNFENGSPPNDTLIRENSSGDLTGNGSAEVKIENHDLSKSKPELDNNSQASGLDSKSTDSAETKDAELQKSKDFSDSSNNSTESLSFDSSVGSGNKTESSPEMEDGKEVEKSDSDIGTYEKLESTVTASPEGEIQHEDGIDESDASDLLEEKHVRNDLDTLPDIQTEGTNSEDDVAVE